MNTPISVILTYMRPGETWVLRGDEYSDLEWLDSTPMPTLSEIEEFEPQVELLQKQEAERLEKQRLEKETARESAFMKLKTLGLTDIEISSLIGGSS